MCILWRLNQQTGVYEEWVKKTNMKFNIESTYLSPDLNTIYTCDNHNKLQVIDFL